MKTQQTAVDLTWFCKLLIVLAAGQLVCQIIWGSDAGTPFTIGWVAAYFLRWWDKR